METATFPTPRSGDVIFTAEPGFEGFVSILVQNNVDPLAKASPKKFTHVAIAVNSWLALEAVPAPTTEASAASDTWLSKLLARFGAKNDAKQIVHSEETWSGIDLGYGARKIAIADILVGADRKGTKVLVLRHDAVVDPSIELFDTFSDSFISEIGSEYSVSELRKSMEEALASSRGVLDRAFPVWTRLKLWVARSAPHWTAPAADIRARTKLTPAEMQKLESYVPNAFPDYEQRPYFCSQLIPKLLHQAKLLKPTDVDKNISPTGLYKALIDLGWKDATASDYGKGSICALQTSSLAKATCQANYSSLENLHGIRRDQIVIKATIDYMTESMNAFGKSLEETTNGLNKMSAPTPSRGSQDRQP